LVAVETDHFDLCGGNKQIQISLAIGTKAGLKNDGEFKQGSSGEQADLGGLDGLVRLSFRARAEQRSAISSRRSARLRRPGAATSPASRSHPSRGGFEIMG